MPMRILPIVLILVLLLCTGCSVMAPLPTADLSDPNIGGGKVDPSDPQSPDADGDSGGGIGLPETDLSGLPTVEINRAPVIDLPQAATGKAVQHGDLTLTIGTLQNNAESFSIEFTVSGVSSSSQASAAPVEPAIVLPDGSLLPPISGEGSGEPGRETVLAVFPALPAGTQSFHLVLENQWSGAAETWRVPISLQP